MHYYNYFVEVSSNLSDNGKYKIWDHSNKNCIEWSILKSAKRKKKKKKKTEKINLKIYNVISTPYARRIKLSRDGDFLLWI